jgi:hypothetical protein
VCTPDEDPVESPADKPPDSGDTPSPRWFVRVLPVTCVAVVVVAVLAALLPGFREQVQTSVTRQAQPYVELYFTPKAAVDLESPAISKALSSRGSPTSISDGAQVTCARRGAHVLVAFALRSHLGKREAIAYRVRVDPLVKHARTLSRAGTVELAPGESSDVQALFRVPFKQGYVLSVVLPGREQLLRARCGGVRS